MFLIYFSNFLQKTVFDIKPGFSTEKTGFQNPRFEFGLLCPHPKSYSEKNRDVSEFPI